MNYKFNSRRSPLLCLNGCVSSSQPLASSIGLDILRKYPLSNAADCAIAVAASLAVLEPCSTGLGGDMFALFYDASSRTVSCINGSGRSPGNLTIDLVQKFNKENTENLHKISPHCVTVPGAALGWQDFWNKFGSGSISFEDLLEPAISLANDGFPLAPVTSHEWASGIWCVRHWDDILRIKLPHRSSISCPFTISNKTPVVGQVFKNPELGNVLRRLGRYGAKEGFYNAFPGKEIVQTLQELGGVMTMEDLNSHVSTFPDPICAEYRDFKLWQVPPNGQGVAGLVALKGLEALEQSGNFNIHDDTELYHAMIEMMRLGFMDARSFVSDLDFFTNGANKIGSVDWFLDEHRISERANRLFDKNKAVIQGYPDPSGCTVSFQVIDKFGNGVSFVNSNFIGFGTGIVPRNCGFSLQSRGSGFSLDSEHANSLEPRKRPYHTIIPGMLTHSDTNELFATLSNMGGFMQPQGHLQLAVNLISKNFDPQRAVDEPRFCIGDGTHNGAVYLEKGVPNNVSSSLKLKGHDIVSDVYGFKRALFGKAQIIKRDRSTGVLWAGSDGRADGCAMGY